MNITIQSFHELPAFTVLDGTRRVARILLPSGNVVESAIESIEDPNLKPDEWDVFEVGGDSGLDDAEVDVQLMELDIAPGYPGESEFDYEFEEGLFEPDTYDKAFVAAHGERRENDGFRATLAYLRVGGVICKVPDTMASPYYRWVAIAPGTRKPEAECSAVEEFEILIRLKCAGAADEALTCINDLLDDGVIQSTIGDYETDSGHIDIFDASATVSIVVKPPPPVTQDPVLAALLTASPTEARAVLEVLAAFVENEHADCTTSEHLTAAEALLGRMNAARAGLADDKAELERILNEFPED